MTTLTQAPPALESPEVLTPTKSSLDNCSTSKRVAALSAALNDLSANDLDSLASILKDRARGRRVEIDYNEAFAAVANAPLSPMAERSPFADAIRVRVATRRIIERGQYHQDQIRNVMLVIAFGLAPHERIARTAVAKGIEDGLALLKDRAENG
jgi:hypothetical protein